MDTGVIIVGAGPAGLMLAGELCLAGTRPLVLERQPRLRETPKANGFNGQIVELLRYRGLLGRVGAASGRPVRPAPAAPFGDMELDFSHLADPPVWAVHLPQPWLERLLSGHARELGTDLRTAETGHRPADALLIRPDAHIAWAATTGESAGTAEPALREALSCWFGTPLKTTVPMSGRPS